MREFIADQHHLPTHPDVPLSARRMADEVAADYVRNQQLASQGRAEKAYGLAQEVRRGVYDLIGSENYDAFRHMLRTERIKVRDLLKPPEGLTSDARELHRARIDRANAFLRELGVVPERLAELSRRNRGGIADILAEQPTQGGAGSIHTAEQFSSLYPEMWRQLRHPEESPLDLTVFFPPYDGWQAGWYFNPFGSDFRGGHLDFIDAAAGIAGNQVNLDNDDAGNFDFADALADTQIAFWYLPPATGPVNVVVEAQSFQAAHHLCTSDEFGWSESDTGQSNSLMMHVLHPNVAGPSSALASDFRWMTDVSECLDRTFIPGGSTFFTRLSTAGVVPVGEWVLIRAGTRSYSRSFTDDVEIHSESRFQWFIRSVAVQIMT